jgi:uncharacterized protein with PIN domain
MMPEFIHISPWRVVDSWAMVAWVRDEPAAGAVEKFLEEAGDGLCRLGMNWINVAETFYILAKRDSAAVADEFYDPVAVASDSRRDAG